MSAIIIRTYPECVSSEVLRGMKEIFFETSAKKDFKDEEEKESFYHKYLGFYLETLPDITLVAQDDKVRGYVTGHLSSVSPEIIKLQPHMEHFKDLFTRFPAHLHINLDSEVRGMGLGSKLLKEFERLLKMAGSTGVHLMTTASSRNREFYLKNGYVFQEERIFNGSPILFMAKPL